MPSANRLGMKVVKRIRPITNLHLTSGIDFLSLRKLLSIQCIITYLVPLGCYLYYCRPLLDGLVVRNSGGGMTTIQALNGTSATLMAKICDSKVDRQPGFRKMVGFASIRTFVLFA